MALTMTRNRTQTTLTKLATSLADCRLAIARLEAAELGAATADRLETLRRQEAALVVTLLRFDSTLNLEGLRR
jgi:hypothetical protein